MVSRSRPTCFCAVLIIIVAGLATRRFPWLMPAALGKYPGDALWALMMFYLWCTAWPRASSLKIAGAALITCYVVEFSQLYQAPWINAVRKTTPGHLILGSGFHAMDLVAYATGVVFGIVLDKAARRAASRRPALARH